MYFFIKATPGKYGDLYSWSAAWEDARSRLLHVAHPANADRWRQYWDQRSASYGKQISEDGSLREAVTGFMTREGLLTPGDDVLEIGCGPGVYTLPMAKTARSVTALDVSHGMLDRLAGEAAKRGIDNIRTVCSDWESYRGRKKYDLVFSAFCPGVDSPQTLLRMERQCRRHCCYATGGSLGQPAFMHQLWEMLTGERPRPQAERHFFAFNALLETGRVPSVRAFMYRSGRVQPREEVVRNMILYFDMLLSLDERQKRMIREYVSAHLPEDSGEEEADRSMYLVYWQPVR